MKKEMLINALVEKGWYHEEHFMDNFFCSELLNEARSLPWKEAKIGQGQDGLRDENIRNDSIYWIDEENATELQKIYLNKMDEVKTILNRELFFGIREFECHFAHYKTSGFYKKHLDQHRNSTKRLISTVFYLNDPIEGGELAIYSQNNPDMIEAKIKPLPGSFVCFLSNQIYHEVLPTTNERFSLTGWFRGNA